MDGITLVAGELPHASAAGAELPDERRIIMKRFLCLAVLALGLALPARAQFGGQSVGSGSSLNSGSVSHSLPSVSPTQFATNGFSGTESDFVPTAFVAYDQAIAAGNVALAAKAKSVAKAAAENNSAQKTPAKFAMMQDANGDAIIVREMAK
jgi:hypothetical protein